MRYLSNDNPEPLQPRSASPLSRIASEAFAMPVTPDILGRAQSAPTSLHASRSASPSALSYCDWPGEGGRDPENPVLAPRSESPELPVKTENALMPTPPTVSSNRGLLDEDGQDPETPLLAPRSESLQLQVKAENVLMPTSPTASSNHGLLGEDGRNPGSPFLDPKPEPTKSFIKSKDTLTSTTPGPFVSNCAQLCKDSQSPRIHKLDSPELLIKSGNNLTSTPPPASSNHRRLGEDCQDAECSLLVPKVEPFNYDEPWLSYPSRPESQYSRSLVNVQPAAPVATEPRHPMIGANVHNRKRRYPFRDDSYQHRTSPEATAVSTTSSQGLRRSKRLLGSKSRDHPKR